MVVVIPLDLLIEPLVPITPVNLVIGFAPLKWNIWMPVPVVTARSLPDGDMFIVPENPGT
jgi:hypothetical protein